MKHHDLTEGGSSNPEASCFVSVVYRAHPRPGLDSVLYDWLHLGLKELSLSCTKQYTTISPTELQSLSIVSLLTFNNSQNG